MENDRRDRDRVAIIESGLKTAGGIIVLGILLIVLQNQAFLAVEDAVFGPYLDERMDDVDRSYRLALGSIYGDALRTVCTKGFDMEAGCGRNKMLGAMEDRDIEGYDMIRTYYRDAFRVSYVNSLREFVPGTETETDSIPQAETLILSVNVALYNIAAASLYRSIDNATETCESNDIPPADCFTRIEDSFGDHETDQQRLAVEDCSAFPVGKEFRVFAAEQTGNDAVDTLTWATRPTVEATFNSSVADFCQAVDAIDSQLLRHIYRRAFYMSVMAIVTADATTRTQERMERLGDRIREVV
jgi:hypothetical protein